MKTFYQQKMELCREIYKYDVCSGNEELTDNTFNYDHCMRPAVGFPDLIYLVATAPDKDYLKRRIETYKGHSVWRNNKWCQNKMVTNIIDKNIIPTDRDVEIAQCKDCGDTAIHIREELGNGWFVHRIICTKCKYYVSQKYFESCIDDDNTEQIRYNEVVMLWNRANIGDFGI